MPTDNSQVYPLPSFRFAITVLGVTPLPNSSFMEASGFGGQVEVEEVLSGGQNGFKFKLPSATTYTNLTLKRGILPTESPLVLWCKETLLLGTNTQIIPYTLTLCLINEEGFPARTWTFVDAYPVKYQTSDFKSTDNTVAIEIMEFAYKFFL